MALQKTDGIEELPSENLDDRPPIELGSGREKREMLPQVPAPLQPTTSSSPSAVTRANDRIARR